MTMCRVTWLMFASLAILGCTSDKGAAPTQDRPNSAPSMVKDGSKSMVPVDKAPIGAGKSREPKRPVAPGRVAPIAAGKIRVASTAKPRSAAKIETRLPPANRVFSIDFDGDGQDEILGADGRTLWAYRVRKNGYSKLWVHIGRGTVHRVAFGTLGKKNAGGPQLFTARGIARGDLKAPLVVHRIDPKTGKETLLWEHSGPRNEPAHLSIADVDGDGVPELAFAYYASKYQVKPYHFKAGGGIISGAPIRMASSRAYGTVSSLGQIEVVGRVYGDARGLPGDLSVRFGGKVRKVPTDKGVRSVLLAKAGSDTEAAVYFADGWVANYGKEAKAQLKTVSLSKDGNEPVRVGQSPSEFTFFDVEARDVTGNGHKELVARGNKYVTIFQKTGNQWRQWIGAELPPVVNAAILRQVSGRFFVAIPDKQHTKVVPLQVTPAGR